MGEFETEESAKQGLERAQPSLAREGEDTMKRLLSTLILVCMFLPMASMAVYATPPTGVSGELD